MVERLASVLEYNQKVRAKSVCESSLTDLLPFVVGLEQSLLAKLVVPVVVVEGCVVVGVAVDGCDTVEENLAAQVAVAGQLEQKAICIELLF